MSAPDRPPTRISEEMSHTIRVARVACIFLMMFTHVRPYPAFTHFPQDGLNWSLHLVYASLALILGKASVPLLGAVSGWLFAVGWKGGWRQNALRKTRTVLLPLLIWNGIVLAILFALPDFEPRWRRPDDALGWVAKIFPLTEYPTNSPLYFLRDLFLCTLAAPVLLWLFDRFGRIGMAGVLAAACLFAIVAGEHTVFTKPVILPTFVLGLIIARIGIDVLRRDFFIAPLMLAAAIWVAIDLAVIVPVTGTRFVWSPWVGHLPELVTRFALAYLLWRGITMLAEARAGRTLALIEPYIFFIFCSHHIVQLFFWEAFGGFIRNGPFSPVYLLYFFAQPVLAMLAGIAGYRILAMAAPGVLGVLTGGRVRRPHGQLALTS